MAEEQIRKPDKNPPICFRPIPEVRAALKEYVEDNDIDNVSRLINYALVEKMGIKIDPWAGTGPKP